MTWRRVGLAACWIAAAGWGIFYLTAVASQSFTYAFVAIAHFVIGYALAGALMASPLTPIRALLAIFAAGAFTHVALAFGFPELLVAPLGPIAGLAAADWTTRRNLAYSAGAFVAGFLAVVWLSP